MSAELHFADDKAPDALRTIGEVSAALGLRQHVLRYWEEQFPMLSPLKRSGGRRYYRPADIALLQRIDELVHRQGYTLRGARLALGGPAPTTSPPVQAAAPVVPSGYETSFGMRARLVALRHTLASALQDA